MDAKLVVAKGKTAVKEIPLAESNTIIGRRNDCGLRIPSPLVSRQHCELKCSGDRLLVRDLGSSNGTLVNGARIKQKELKSGDTLGVGPVTFIVKLGKEASPSDTARPGEAAAIDAADFVIGDESEGGELADFVSDADAADDADFVVAEPVAEADDAESDFVVSDETNDTTVGEVSDFIVSDGPVGEAESDFVVDAEPAEDDTVHNVQAKDVKKKADAGKETKPTEAEEAPKKGGLFGRLFKKKEKKTEKPAAAEAKEEKPQPPAKKAKGKTEPEPTAAPAAAAATESDDAGFFVTDDDAPAGESKAVGDDELADFLMGLNEKDQ